MINMQTQDTTLTCSECGQQFTFTAREQLSSAQRGQGTPSLCAFCRAARMIAGGARSMPANAERSGRTERSEHQMYPAVCSDCGRQTTVPFQPRRDRPVYCSNCYPNHSSDSRRYDRNGRRPDSYARR